MSPALIARRLSAAGCWLIVGAAWIAAVSNEGLRAELPSGEAIYRKRCASCHGSAGQGVKDGYAHPLVGERSLADLTQVIAKTMPEDAPGTCVGDEAARVASYIYDTFYSPLAQARNKPARIELSRLTVRQQQNAVADLIGSFQPSGGRIDAQRGLRAEYFKSKQFQNQDRAIQRIDPQVRFDFGRGSPQEGVIDPKEFSTRWQGSLLAADTGEYEFVIRSENAARLWINDLQKPLIDAAVKSGSDTEYRAAVRLLGGRWYPLRLEFTKTAAQPTASIRLCWKLPRRAEEPLPERNLAPQTAPRAFVLQTPFPPDDRSVGYERGTAVSQAWDVAVTDAAIETADFVAAHLPRQLGLRDDAPQRATRYREACRQFIERAFRRPLSAEVRQLYVDRQFERVGDPDTAVRRAVTLALKSPRFLYREIGAAADAYDTAARLALALWDSLPDQDLLRAAAGNQLNARAQLAAQAQRMAGDLRTQSKLREFFLQWLKVEQVPDLAKDPALYPGFDLATASDLRTSLELALDDLLTSPSANFQQLFSNDEVYLNGRLARFYGLELPPDAAFRKLRLGPDDRAGILSHPYLMSNFAYTASSSPIHRGVFLARSVLGRSLRPPPIAVAPLAVDLHPQMTTRARVTLQTEPQACQTCHSLINPLGFALENYDAVGRYRLREGNQPVDASGSYASRTAGAAKFTGARQLAAFLAASRETHDAFVEQLFHYLIKQPIRAYGLQAQQDLRRGFEQSGFNIRTLATEIAVVAALASKEESHRGP